MKDAGYKQLTIPPHHWEYDYFSTAMKMERMLLDAAWNITKLCDNNGKATASTSKSSLIVESSMKWELGLICKILTPC